jgi:hypothetical protein
VNLVPAKKPHAQSDDPEQYRRFVEVARELGVDDNDPDAMDRAFKKINVQGPQSKRRTPAKR